MLTWVTRHRRRTAACLPRLEPLEDRWLLDGSALLAPSRVPAPSPDILLAAPMPEGPVLVASPHDIAFDSGPTPLAPDGSACATADPTPGPAGDATFLPTSAAPRLVIVIVMNFAPFQPGGGDVQGDERHDPASQTPIAAPIARPAAADAVAAATALPAQTVTAAPADRASSSGTTTATLAGAVAALLVGAGPTHVAENPGPRGSAFGASAGSGTLVAAAAVVRPSGTDVALAAPALVHGHVEGPAEPDSPGNVALPPGNHDERAPDAELVALPRLEGLITEGVQLGTSALERAARALAEPMLSADAASAGVLYWLGFSSWLLAAALAGEGARRCLLRGPQNSASPPRTTDLLPEADL
jgi:hypothetical protein